MATTQAVEIPPGIIRALRADPDHAPERLVLFAVERLVGDARDFAAAAPAGPMRAHAAAAERRRVMRLSRVDGAIAGTPFLIAFVPAYVSFLWEQVRMVLRLAALEGRDPADPAIPAELLAFRGVYPSVPAAEGALAALPLVPGKRLVGGIRGLVLLGRRLAVLGGFLGPPPDERPSRLRQAALMAVAGVVWAITWIVPITFMIVLSVGCASSTSELGERAVEYYGTGTVPAQRAGVGWRPALVGLGIGAPLALLAWGATTAPSLHTSERILLAVLGLSVVLVLGGLLRFPRLR